MTSETTTTTANDVTYSAVIAPVMMATLAEHALPMSLCREFNIINEPSNAIDVTVADSDVGSADDDGAGVDTEFDATEGSELGNTAFDTSKVTLTAAELGIAYEVTDNVREDTISGIDLFSAITSHMNRALALAWTDNFCALFASLSNSVGGSGSAATVAHLLAAQVGPRRRGTVADDGMTYVLDNKAAGDVESQLTSTIGSAAVYAFAADRMLQANVGPNNGMGQGRQVMSFRGYPVIATGLTDTADSSVNVVSACFTHDGPRNRDYATFGNAIKRLPRFEQERHAKKRTTDLVLTMRMGVGELLDGTGTKIVTGA